MSQTSTIFFFVIIGFIIYVTTKGELPKYLSVILGTAKTAT